MPSPHEHTVRPDAKGRISLGVMARGVSSYRVHEEKDGRIILEPYTEVPAREAWLFQNKKALEQVKQGIEDAAQGKLSPRGDFSQYLGEELD